MSDFKEFKPCPTCPKCMSGAVVDRFIAPKDGIYQNLALKCMNCDFVWTTETADN